jgi:hypothetical protein
VYDTLEDVDLQALTGVTIPCSGTGHFTEPRLHDSTQCASFIIRITCPYCPKNYLRPVCEYFTTHGTDPDRSISCSGCGKISFADESIHVVGPL